MVFDTVAGEMDCGKCHNIILVVWGLSSRSIPQNAIQRMKIITATQIKEYGVDLDNFTSLH